MAGARKHFQDDEDLFDFPVIELTLDGVKEASVDPETSIHPEVESLIDQLEPAHAAAPYAAAHELTPAATLVHDLAHLAPELLEGERRAPVPQPTKSAMPARSFWLLCASILLLNGLGFFFLWHTSTSFGAGLEELRNDLALTAREMQLANARSQQAPTQLAEPDPEPRVLDPEHEPSAVHAPLESYDAAALRLARAELDAGEHAAARKRLHRLMALADRLDPDVRATVEARAAYWIAQSYSLAAAKQRGGTP